MFNITRNGRWHRNIPRRSPKKYTEIVFTQCWTLGIMPPAELKAMGEYCYAVALPHRLQLSGWHNTQRPTLGKDDLRIFFRASTWDVSMPTAVAGDVKHSPVFTVGHKRNTASGYCNDGRNILLIDTPSLLSN